MKGTHDALQGRSSKTLDSNLDYPSWRDILGNERFFAKDSFYKSSSDYIKNIDREKVFSARKYFKLLSKFNEMKKEENIFSSSPLL